MNLDKKLELAHEYFQKTISHIRKHDIQHDFSEIISESWEYADEMEKQYNKRKPSGLPDALKEEWQPDWSQAPDDRINYWSKESDGTATWWIGEPTKNIPIGTHHDNDCCSCLDDAPAFNYQGDWKDSLRKRPINTCEHNGEIETITFPNGLVMKTCKKCNAII